MRTFFWVALMSLGGGLLAHFGIRMLAPEVAPTEFGNVVGLVAIVCGLAGWALSKRRHPGAASLHDE